MTLGMLRRDASRLARGFRSRARSRLIGQPTIGTSFTHPTPYPSFCRRAARSDAVFATFKRDPVYVNVLEHVTCEQGGRYLQRLLQQSRELEAMLPVFKANDRLGDPVRCEYEGHGAFSPTTLRYAKVLSDLLSLFGTLDGLRIAEIGGGYGGQCLLISLIAEPASYSLIDLHSVLDLQEVYLRKHAVRGVRFIAADRVPKRDTYDLVISNYAFSECTRAMQETYMNRVVQRSPRGYMAYNWLSPEWAGVPFSRSELLAAIPGSRFMPPVPKLVPEEELWLWGSEELPP